MCRARPKNIQADYWTLARAGEGWRIDLAGSELPADLDRYARDLFGLDDDAQILAYHDKARGDHRLALFDGQTLVAAMFVSSGPLSVSRNWAVEQMASGHEDTRSRYLVVAGRAGGDHVDPGAIVCSCFSVGINQIVEAIVRDGCTSVEEIGKLLHAGTNCGSCRSEIRDIIDERTLLAAE